MLLAAVNVLVERGIDADVDTLLSHKVYPGVMVVIIIADGRKFSVPWLEVLQPEHAEQPPEPLIIRDVPANTLAVLVESGFTTLDSLAETPDEVLLAIDGIGKAMLKRIRANSDILEAQD